MKKSILFAASIAMLASCANEEIVDKGNSLDTNVPIILSTNRQNITRGTSNLEDNLHYNFGVWAQKVKSGATAQTIMENYLVGWSNGTSKGYDKTNATTYATAAGTTSDHTSPWFYEGLGTNEYNYEGTDGFYKKTDNAYMSAHQNQYLRYWDLAYTNTYFYCYAPYQKTGVETTMATDGSATMKLAANVIRDGYDYPVNSNYSTFDRSLAEFMVGGYKATNSALADVTIPFKHLGAQVFIRFYEDVPGYKVEIVDLSADNGNFGNASTELKTGIQATPATVGSPSYTKGTYYTSSGATVNFADGVPSFEFAYPTDATATVMAKTTQDNLMFHAPTTDATKYSTAKVPDGFGSVENKNWTKIDNTQSATTTHYVIPEVAATTAQQNYAWSPTIYYPVAQPTNSATGFTFHVTYRIIADDNKEVTTVHNATVFVPASQTTGGTTEYITAWQANTRYIYTFKITKNSTGSTDPTPTVAYDPTDPTPSTKKSLFPIVFDGATIVDYTESTSEHIISPETTTYQ
ncbi:MAG: hypothetical protein MJZ35_00180 [Bacteroidaceae bacterium]|nr:hypothetical protein [Bacteroidaceae bacterium]